MTPVADLTRCPVCSADLTETTRGLGPGQSLPCPKPYCRALLRLREGDTPDVRNFKLVDHYSLCVLPFSFDDEAAEAVGRVGRSGRWREQVFALDDPDDVDRMEYFLPYIRDFLFPRVAREDRVRAPVEGATCTHWFFDLGRLGPVEGGGLRVGFRCRDTRKRQTFSYELELREAELLLFSYKVGFLVLNFRCRGEAGFFDQMNTVNYLRPIAPLYQGFEMATLTTGGRPVRMPQLLAYLLAELGGGPAPEHPSSLEERPPLPVRPTYDDRMMVYTFSCLDKTTCLDDAVQSEKLLAKMTVVNFENEPIPVRDPEPGREDHDEWLRTRWQGFSKEGSCLVVFDTDRYHEKFLGVYHGTYYFDIFLLAALQRVTLLTLYERLANISALTSGSHARRNLRRLRRDLLLFKNQCCFSQITNRERGLVLWRRWQEVFENGLLLREVNDQSAELDSYTQSRTRERIEWFLRLGGFLAAALPLILGLNAIFPEEQWGESVGTVRNVLIALLVVGSLAFAGFLFFRREE